MTVYVEVAVNVPRVSGVFHYHLPPELETQVKPGQLVIAPFGQQTVQGVVLSIIDQPEVAKTKAVQAVLDENTTVTFHQIKLAKQIAQETLAPLAACIGLMLPPGLSQQADTLFTLADDIPGDSVELNDIQTRLVALLHKRGPLRGRQVDRAIPKRNWRPAARQLVKQGWLTSQAVLPPPTVRPKFVRTAQLSVPPEIVRAGLEGLGKTAATQERRQKMIDFLVNEPGPVDVSWVYAQSAGKLDDLRVLNDKGLVILREKEAWRDPLAGIVYDPSAPPQLTEDQQEVWERISTGLQAAGKGEAVKPYLLHGVTGSGKTEIYLRAVAETLKQGKQALVLVPEIALTPQTTRRFVARFPGRVGLLHSQLSIGERYDTWRRARAGSLSVIVGPRSALFAPLPDIGLVVVDESHDESYYQTTGLPYYHARRAAVELAHITGAVCILGTATPDVVSYTHAQQGKWTYLSLPDRVLAHQETIQAYERDLGQTNIYQPGGGEAQMAELPPVELVDMRNELKRGNRSIFSQSLQESLGDVLEKSQQAILFLNRRGTASYVFCRDCGYVARCPNCDTPLSYHQSAKGQLTCHHCGYRRNMIKSCPECGSQRIRHYGTGTEAVEQAVQELFPDARTLRWDHETTRQKGAHDIILSHFTNHRADILIGTQMLAKGLDLPLVTLVGVVLADVGLHMPDYRAGERVFQVLSQVAGRAGRSPLGGKVVLQTFHPDHYVIQAAAAHDYAGFVEKELGYRKQLGYPPYARLVRLVYKHRDAAKAEQEAKRLAGQIKTWIKQGDRRATEIVGPTPCFYTRRKGEYRWQIILRGPEPAVLLEGRALGDWQVEVDPQSLL